MNIGERAYRQLLGKRSKKKIKVAYSSKFKPYNANLHSNSRKLEFRLSERWKKVSEDIQIGLAQHLLQKLYRTKKRTMNIELYEKFMERLPRYLEKEPKRSDPDLEKAFRRINRIYFGGFLDMPNLEWGAHSTAQLGIYSYYTDTVRMSRIFQDLTPEKEWMLDYVLYHELLHKKFGLQHKNGNCRHHTPEFKRWEAMFSVDDAEKKLNAYVGRKVKNKRRKVRNIFK